MKMCVSLQQRTLENVEMHVSVQWRAPKCMKVAFRHNSVLVLRGTGSGGTTIPLGGARNPESGLISINIFIDFFFHSFI